MENREKQESAAKKFVKKEKRNTIALRLSKSILQLKLRRIKIEKKKETAAARHDLGQLII